MLRSLKSLVLLIRLLFHNTNLINALMNLCIISGYVISNYCLYFYIQCNASTNTDNVVTYIVTYHCYKQVPHHVILKLLHTCVASIINITY